MKELTINAPGIAGSELVIREGHALPLKEPIQIKLSGDINSISKYIDGRSNGSGLQQVNKDLAIIIVDKDAMTIELQLDPNSPYGTMVTGTLELTEDIKLFGINKNKKYTREAMVELLRFNRIKFEDKDQFAKILLQFQTLIAGAKVDLSASSDTRGNKDSAFKKEVTSNIAVDFILLIDVFKGQVEPSRIRVEICQDVTDGGARFWLESTELHELIQTERDRIFGTIIDKYKDFVIINK